MMTPPRKKARSAVLRRHHASSLSAATTLVTVFLLLVARASVTQALHVNPASAEAPIWSGMDVFVSSDLYSDTITCFNGGIPAGNHCTCPLYYTSANCSQRQCPNSIGGVGPHHVLPVNSTNKFCDHCDEKEFTGLNCQICQSNEACKQYAGKSAECNRRPSVRSDSKQFQCTLQNEFFVRLMGGNRTITVEVMLNCSTPDGTALQKSDQGVCNMAVYRMEPNHSYVDAFFRCNATECSVKYGQKDPDPNDTSNNTLRLRFFRVARTSGQVVLIVECALLALLGAFTALLGPRRTKRITVILASVITVTVLLYIALMMLSMRSISIPKETVIYECQKTSCACAEDPPPQYDPICSQKMELSNIILPSIKNRISFACELNSSLCELTLADLALVFQADCSISECVDTIRFPDDSSDDSSDRSGAAILAKLNLGILLVLLLLLLVSGVGTHYYYTRSISYERDKDFLVTFHVNTLEGDDSDVHETGSTVLDERHVHLNGNTAEHEPESLLNNSPAPHLERPALLPQDAPSSPHSEENVSITTSVYEQARTLTPAAYTRIEELRRLTATQLELQVSDLQYTLKAPLLGAADEGSQRTLLHRINFTVHSGDVLAIMGPSGAGKTTLLDLLSARAKSGKVSGTIVLNGTPIKTTGSRAAQYRNIIGYVSQEDTLLPSLTVEQTIFYAARLKLPKALSHSTVRRIVTRVIETLKLQHCAQTLIGGDTTRGISGGEKRRVSIAVELLANPRILYLDEPTSGLDAVSAKRVVEAVVALAKDSPMRMYAMHYFAFRPVVIFSIHQPSQEIYELFDKVLLLSRGMSIYCGPASSAGATIERRVTAAFGHTREVPRREAHNNQAEYLMKVEEILDDAVRAELQEEDTLENTNTADAQYESASVDRSPLAGAHTQVPPCRSPGSPSPHASSQSGSCPGFNDDGEQVSGADILSTTFGFRMYYANVYEQMHLLISRSITCLFGSFHLVVCHSAVVACLATLMCVLYHEQALDLPGALNRAGSVSFLLLVTSFLSLSCLEQFIVERKLFNVERENGFYTTCPYLISKIVVDIIPLRIVPAMVLASVIYFPMGFRVDAGLHFFYFIFIIVLFSICMTMVVLCIGIVSGSFGAAALLSSVLILWNFVFGGDLVQAETIPPPLRAFKSISPFFLAFESLMVNELNGQHCVFSPTDETGKKSSASIPIMCVQYLANIGLKPARFNIDVMQLALYCLLFVGLSWILLSCFSKLVR